jgi:flagellar hook-associated protein 3 FlgL
MIRVSSYNFYESSNQSINADQSALISTQEELATGKQINSPADNPVGAAQAALVQSDLTQLGQYASNQQQATQLLGDSSSTLTQAINILQSVNTTLVEAGNGTLSASDRTGLATQLQQQLNALVGLANTGDGQGGYLFGGSANGSAPFVQDGNAVTYAGDNIASAVQVSASTTVQTRFPGDGVFLQVPTGNGIFATTAGSTNTGSGTITPGTVTSPTALTGDPYTITFGAGGAYQVVNNATSATVASGTYTGPTTIGFDGMQVELSGSPAAGDTFDVTPAGTQSVFGIVANAISALQMPAGAASSADLSSALSGVGQSITSLSTTQAAMGSQLQQLNNYASVNSSQTLQDQTQMSNLVDVNYAQAVSQLSQQQTQFQAALQSYADISKLSLFNYVS